MHRFIWIISLRLPTALYFSLALFVQLASPLALNAWQTIAPAVSDLSGKVVDDGGKSVKGAIVHLMGSNNKSIAPSDSSATGVFTISQVPLGDYDVCVYVPQSDYVDECLWAPLNRFIGIPLAAASKISSSPIVTGVKYKSTGSNGDLLPDIKLRKGSTLEVRIDDTAQLVGTGRLLVSIVLPKGDAFPMTLKSKQSQKLVYQYTIPRDQDVQVVIAGIGLELASTANGPGKGMITLTARAGAKDDIVSLDAFTVKGKGAVK